MKDIRKNTGVFTVVAIGIVILLAVFFSKAEASDLGPDTPTTFTSVAPAIIFDGSNTEPSVRFGLRQSWDPFDIVGEVILKATPGASVFVARSFGDFRALAGVNLQTGTPAFGIDYKQLMLRVTAYDTVTKGTCRRWRCSPSKTENHTALTVGVVIPIGGK